MRVGGAAKGAVREAFRRGCDGYGGDRATDDHERYRHQQGGAAWEGGVGGDGAEAADHEDLAVGEVDELDDAVDHGVPDGYEAIEGTEGKAVGQLLRQFVHRRASDVRVGYESARGRCLRPRAAWFIWGGSGRGLGLRVVRGDYWLKVSLLTSTHLPPSTL